MRLKNLILAVMLGTVVVSSPVEAKPKAKALESVVLESPLPGHKAPPVHQCHFKTEDHLSICDFEKYGASTKDGRINPHQGLDLRSPEGTVLTAPVSGTVIGAGHYRLDSHGNKVRAPMDNGNEVRILSTDRKYEVTLIHLKKASVDIGDKVELNSKVGILGTTGNADPKEPHVHVQLKKLDGNGKSHLLNPLDYLHFTGTKPSMNSSVKYHPLSASVEDKVDQEDLLRDCAKIKRTYGRVSPENLIYLARLVYFEAGTDGKVTSPNYQKGLDAVIHVMLNRKEFDTQYKVTAEEQVKGKKGKRKLKSVVVTENKTHERRFAEDGHLLDVVKGEGAQQFTAVAKNAPYFEPSSFKDKNGRYSLVFGEELSSDPDLQERMLHSYHAVVSALEGKSQDPTKGALYYRNPSKVQTDFPKNGATAFTQVIPKHTVGEGLEERTEFDYVLSKSAILGSHVFYTAKIVAKTTRYDNSKGTTTYKEKR